MTRRGALDRIVDLAVAVPTCTLVAVRRAVPIALRLGAEGSARALRRVDRLDEHLGIDEEWEAAAAAGSAGADIDAATTDDSDVATIAVDELPIDGYDDLAARQVVDRLGDLDGADLARIEVYEREHRSRSTVLGKIAQLTQ